MQSITEEKHYPLRHAVTDNLDQLLETLPTTLQQSLHEQPNLEDLLEIVLDLGRLPEARFPGGYVTLGNCLIENEDLNYVTERVGEFGKDNRAGIERTLHRISAIRNRSGRVVGLTCRIGRAVYGTIDIIRDVIESGQNILMLGRPGIGKTTKLREVARVLSTEMGKRVIVVDTSNEIAGDGDIPHPAIGAARRMQVGSPEQQHAVMIEAVENHMPEVIVIDEIGTEADTNAARTIAERGVQLVGTAHGISLENIMMNPTLADLIGGIQPVTLGDEEARRRGTQKTVLERKAPPTFDCLIELMDIDRLAIHRDVSSVVDRILRGENARPEIRVGQPGGSYQVVQSVTTQTIGFRPNESGPETPSQRSYPAFASDTLEAPSQRLIGNENRQNDYDEDDESVDTRVYETGRSVNQSRLRLIPGNRKGAINIFPYGVSRSRLERAIHELSVPATICKDAREANVILTLKAHSQHVPDTVRGNQGLPMFIIKSNTYVQIANALKDVFRLGGQDAEDQAMQEAEQAAKHVASGGDPVDLTPQNSYVRRLQHELVNKYHLTSESVGHGPDRRVRVVRS